MNAAEAGLHSPPAVANGQYLDNHEEFEGEHNEEEEEEEDSEARQAGVAALASTAAGASVATAASSSGRVQPKKASLNAIPFPLARVKRLIKNEDDTCVSSEATYVIAKGVGLFLEKFVEHSFDHMINDRRHSLTYKDLATHVRQAKRFRFLADFVPEKVTAASALSYRLKKED